MNKDNSDYLKSLSILLVEDDFLLQQNLMLTLEPLCKKVYVASHGSEALEIYKKKSISLLIVDYVLPIMDGYSLCKKIRENDKSTPIILISNYKEEDKLLNSIPLNLIDYLVKPIKYETLVNTLEKTVENIVSNNIFLIELNENTQYDKISKTLYKNNETIKLSKTEIKLLELFINNKNQLVTDEMIEYQLDTFDSTKYNAVKNHIYRLRKKIGKDILVNVQSLGYLIKNN